MRDLNVRHSLSGLQVAVELPDGGVQRLHVVGISDDGEVIVLDPHTAELVPAFVFIDEGVASAVIGPGMPRDQVVRALQRDPARNERVIQHRRTKK